MEDLAPMIIAPAICYLIGWVILSLTEGRRRLKLAQMQSELHREVLKKFDSTPELLQYLESQAGMRFLESATIDRASPHGRILGSIQLGIITCFGGLAFYLARNQFPDATQGFTFLGILGMAIGLGFLLSAWAAHSLSRSWGLLDPKRSPGA